MLTIIKALLFFRSLSQMVIPPIKGSHEAEAEEDKIKGRRKGWKLSLRSREKQSKARRSRSEQPNPGLTIKIKDLASQGEVTFSSIRSASKFLGLSHTTLSRQIRSGDLSDYVGLYRITWVGPPKRVCTIGEVQSETPQKGKTQLVKQKTQPLPLPVACNEQERAKGTEEVENAVPLTYESNPFFSKLVEPEFNPVPDSSSNSEEEKLNSVSKSEEDKPKSKPIPKKVKVKSEGVKSKPVSFRVKIVDKETGESKIYDTVTEAARAIGMNRGSLSRRLSSNVQTAYRGRYTTTKL